MLEPLKFLVAALPLVSAFPTVMEMTPKPAELEKRKYIYPKVPKPKSHTQRDNCGAAGHCTTFDEKDQLISVSGKHRFIAPSKDDLRGQCPGLNAAANHAYLPRSGIASTQDTIDGLGRAYSMSEDLAVILAAISIAISGDPIAMVWSIGNGFKGKSALLGMPTGIAGTHNRYEGDASIIKGDAYMHNGYVAAFEQHRWTHLYNLLGKKGLTHDKAANQAYYTAEFSKLNNPYYFSGPFSGLVAPDAHNFVVNFMSNHSEKHKGGRLHYNVLSQFFGVTGTPPNVKYTPGYERIPENWYKRPTHHPMNTVNTNVDTVLNNNMYPGIIRFGGNTGTTDSFSGVDLGNLTGGVFNSDTILDGNNLSCFFLQASQASLADPLSPLLAPIGKLQKIMFTAVAPQLKELGCPELSSFNNEAFAKFPGYKYKGHG